MEVKGGVGDGVRNSLQGSVVTHLHSLFRLLLPSRSQFPSRLCKLKPSWDRGEGAARLPVSGDLPAPYSPSR